MVTTSIATPRRPSGRRAPPAHPGGSRPDQAVPPARWLVEAVRGVSLEVMPGEFVALMGPSGSGKSTLLQLLGGLDQPTSGEVLLEGSSIGRLSDEQATRLRRERTGFVFQSFNLVPLLNVVENVGLPFTIAGQDPRSGDLAARVRDAIELVDLTGKERHKPEELSAGEQQRVAVARALVTRPALLLADEPTGNLDFRTGIDILDALWRTCVGRGQTIVLVTHDAKAAAYADRVFVIERRARAGRDRAGPARRPRRCSPDRAPRAARAVAPAMRGLVPYAWRSLVARPARSLLSVFGVAIGVAVLVAALAVTAGMDASIDRTVHSIVGRADLRVSAFTETGLSAATAAALDAVPGVALTAPAIERRSFIGSAPGHPTTTEPVTVLGIDPAREPRVHDLTLVRGVPLAGIDQDAALITQSLAAAEGLDVGSELVVYGAGAPVHATVVGVLAGDGPAVGGPGRTVVLPIVTAARLNNPGDGAAAAGVGDPVRAHARGRGARRRCRRGDRHRLHRRGRGHGALRPVRPAATSATRCARQRRTSGRRWP